MCVDLVVFFAGAAGGVVGVTIKVDREDVDEKEIHHDDDDHDACRNGRHIR